MLSKRRKKLLIHKESLNQESGVLNGHQSVPLNKMDTFHHKLHREKTHPDVENRLWSTSVKNHEEFMSPILNSKDSGTLNSFINNILKVPTCHQKPEIKCSLYLINLIIPHLKSFNLGFLDLLSMDLVVLV